MFATQRSRLVAWLDRTTRQSNRERGHREAFAPTAAYAEHPTGPATFSPFSYSRGKNGAAGGRVVSSRLPSSAQSTQATLAPDRGAGCVASVHQRHERVRDSEQQIQGFEYFRRRRDDTAHRRRAFTDMPLSGDGRIVDVTTLEDENRRLKIELHKATEESRKSRAHRMRLESELRRADGKVEALLDQLGNAPMKRDTKLINTARGEVERGAAVRTLLKRNERLQKLLACRDRELVALKRTQEWSAVAEITAATEEYVLEIQRLQQILARYHFATDAQDGSIKNIEDGTGNKLHPSQNGGIPAAEFVQSTRARVEKDYPRTGQKGSDNGAGRRRLRASCDVDDTVWREIAETVVNPILVETSSRHRNRDRAAIDRRKASNTELERGQHERREPCIQDHTTASFIRGNTSHTRVPQGGRSHGLLKVPRSTKTSTRPTGSRTVYEKSAVRSSPGRLRRPRAALNDPECGAERNPVRIGLRSQALRRTVSPVPRGENIQRRRRSRPLSAPLREQHTEQDCRVALVRGGHEVPTWANSNRKSRNVHDSKNPKAKNSTRLDVDACLSARTRGRIAPGIQSSGRRNADSDGYEERNHASDGDLVLIDDRQLGCTRRATATATHTRRSLWDGRERRGVSLGMLGSDVWGSEAERSSEGRPQQDMLHHGCGTRGHGDIHVMPGCKEKLNGVRAKGEPASEHQGAFKVCQLKTGGVGNTNGEHALLQGIKAGESADEQAETDAVDTTPSPNLPDTSTEREASDGNEACAESLPHEHQAALQSREANSEIVSAVAEGSKATSTDICSSLESRIRTETLTTSVLERDEQYSGHETGGSPISRISEVSGNDNLAGRKQVGIVSNDNDEGTSASIAAPGGKDCGQNKLLRHLDPDETCENLRVSAKTVLRADGMESLPSAIEDGGRVFKDNYHGGGVRDGNGGAHKLGPLPSRESPVEVNGVLPLPLKVEDNRHMKFSSLGEKNLSAPASPKAASDGDGISVSTERLPKQGNGTELRSAESQLSSVSGVIPQPSRSSAYGSDGSTFAESERQEGGEERSALRHLVSERRNDEAFPGGSEAETTQYGDDFDADDSDPE